jgi:membrane-associated phospholipid phosphatase
MARALALVGTLSVAQRAVSQTPMAGDSVHAAKTLFTWRDAALASGFVGLTIALFPADRALAHRLQDSTVQESRFFKRASVGIQYFADPGAIVIGTSLYALGRARKWRSVSDLGLHGTEAVVLSGSVTALIKDIAGRARPNFSADTSPGDFAFGRGLKGGGYQSFPSGHTTVAFAAAAVVTSEAQRWNQRSAWFVGPAMYGGATLVGLSRMYNNAHWASDVVLGAAIGTFSGIKVVRYSHGHSNNWIDRALLGMSVSPQPGPRLGVGWSLPVPESTP